ncbi:MAG: hypothetical protein U9N62_07880 [Thermotogota bacterium]|nr:hypothetical protein [Thermotogota bacterium]
MVMVLTLFVYNYLERELRKLIVEQNEMVENHVKKRITNPTMKMVIFQFRGIHTVKHGPSHENQEQAETLNAKQKHILSILGQSYQKLYV